MLDEVDDDLEKILKDAAGKQDERRTDSMEMTARMTASLLIDGIDINLTRQLGRKPTEVETVPTLLMALCYIENYVKDLVGEEHFARFHELARSRFKVQEDNNDDQRDSTGSTRGDNAGGEDKVQRSSGDSDETT